MKLIHFWILLFALVCLIAAIITGWICFVEFLNFYYINKTVVYYIKKTKKKSWKKRYKLFLPKYNNVFSIINYLSDFLFWFFGFILSVICLLVVVSI